MKKNSIFIFLIISLAFSPVKINAMCNDYRMSQLQNFASDINYNYTYIENEKGVTFNVIFTNLKGELAIKDTLNNKTYYDEDEVTIKNLLPNKEYKYEIITAGGVCTLDSLRSVYVKTPSYNKYYKDSLCKNIENYKYCKKWTNVNLTYEEFKFETTKYLNSLNKKEEVTIEETTIDKIKRIIVEIYSKYYIFILIIIILLGLILIIREDKKSDLD